MNAVPALCFPTSSRILCDQGLRKACDGFIRVHCMLALIYNVSFTYTGPRQQLNQITSYMDASHIYGSTRKQADTLRDFTDPREKKFSFFPTY